VAGLVRERIPTESDLRAIRRTLAALREEGLVHRIPYIDLNRETGGPTAAWGLSDRAVASVDLSRHGAKTFDEHSERTLDHELGISRFHMALKRGCDARGLALHWRQTDLKHAIHPDALAAITDPAKPEDANTNWFFVEIERAKLGAYDAAREPSIIRKLARYYDHFNSTDCERAWGIRQFRVLVILSSEGRRSNLLERLRAAFDHRMFLLATEGNCRDDLSQPVFATTKDTAVSIFDL